MRVLLLLAMTACVSTHELVVTVSDANGSPIAGAIVGAICESGSDGGATTDATGTARITLYEDEPDDCTLTIAATGFRTAQIASDDADVQVVLEASP